MFDALRAQAVCEGWRGDYRCRARRRCVHQTVYGQHGRRSLCPRHHASEAIARMAASALGDDVPVKDD